MAKETIIISLGGSVIVPEKVDTKFLKEFCQFIREKSQDYRFILITGGGNTARQYINTAREFDVNQEDLDWIGIAATQLNASLVQSILKDISEPDVIKDPTIEITTEKNIIAGGWKPGFSTDYCAVKFAENLNINKIINLTDIDHVYDKNPKEYPNAKPIDKLSWKEFRSLAGDEWKAGMHLPFDPIASAEAEKHGIGVIILKGISELRQCVEEKEFKGTIIF